MSLDKWLDALASKGNAAEKAESLAGLRRAIAMTNQAEAAPKGAECPLIGLTVVFRWQRVTSPFVFKEGDYVIVAGDVIGRYRPTFNDYPAEKLFVSIEIAQAIRFAAARVRAAWSNETIQTSDGLSIWSCEICEEGVLVHQL